MTDEVMSPLIPYYNYDEEKLINFDEPFTLKKYTNINKRTKFKKKFRRNYRYEIPKRKSKYDEELKLIKKLKKSKFIYLIYLSYTLRILLYIILVSIFIKNKTLYHIINNNLILFILSLIFIVLVSILEMQKIIIIEKMPYNYFLIILADLCMFIILYKLSILFIYKISLIFALITLFFYISITFVFYLSISYNLEEYYLFLVFILYPLIILFIPIFVTITEYQIFVYMMFNYCNSFFTLFYTSVVLLDISVNLKTYPIIHLTLYSNFFMSSVLTIVFEYLQIFILACKKKVGKFLFNK